MAEEFKWLKVDVSEISHRKYLRNDDVCYYYMVRVKGGIDNKANQIISNIKITVEDIKKKPGREKYKIQDAQKMIRALEKILVRAWDKKIIFIPAARSIPRSNRNFDNIFDLIVVSLCKKNPSKWFCEKILDVDVPHDGVHINENERTLENVKNHLVLKSFSTNAYMDADFIIIVDDVLTLGTHFRVWKDSIINKYPEIKDVIGFFFALHKFKEQTIEEIDF